MAEKSPLVSSGRPGYGEMDEVAVLSDNRLVRYRVTDDLVPDEADCLKITASQSMICFAGWLSRIKEFLRAA